MNNKKIVSQTLSERGSRYGSYEDNTKEAMRILSHIDRTRDHLTEYTAFMVASKLSRAVVGDPYYIDNIIDIIGYLKLWYDTKKDKEVLRVRYRTSIDLYDVYVMPLLESMDYQKLFDNETMLIEKFKDKNGGK